MTPLRFVSAFIRPLLLALLVLSAPTVGCTATSSPTLPIPPPAALTASSPDMNGFVTIRGSGIDPNGLVSAYNERLGEGVIGEATSEGMFELRLQGAVGDGITVWQQIGTRTSQLTTTIVPSP